MRIVNWLASLLATTNTYPGRLGGLRLFQMKLL